jgi:hypothetical protein
MFWSLHTQDKDTEESGVRGGREEGCCYPSREKIGVEKNVKVSTRAHSFRKVELHLQTIGD